MDYKDIWNKTLKLLEDDHEGASFNTTVKLLVPLNLKDGALLLWAPKPFMPQTIEKRYGDSIKNKLYAVTGKKLKFEIITDDDSDKYKHVPSLAIKLNSKYVFSAFVKGKSNELAYEASYAVAEKPGQTLYNPLYMYGKVGLGKTHLMHSIGNHIYKKDSSKKILYTSSEDFMNEYIYSVGKYKMPEFRDKFRHVDIFLIDDIQFLIKKEESQAELFHTINTLYDADKQIVISSDQPPKELKTFEDRLTSRFGNGLIVDITFPDYETRIAILEKKAELENTSVPKDITDYIARRITSNIRDLEGAIFKLIAVSKLNSTEITFDMADRVLKDYIRDNGRREITVKLIQEAVAEHFRITPEELIGKSRVKRLTYPRHIAMYLCRNMLPNETTVKIGELFGRDHSTVINGYDNILAELDKDPLLNETLAKLEKMIKE